VNLSSVGRNAGERSRPCFHEIAPPLRGVTQRSTVLYRFADCYLHEDDQRYGASSTATGGSHGSPAAYARRRALEHRALSSGGPIST